MSNTQIVPAEKKYMTVRDLIEKSKTRITQALPKHLSADRLINVALFSIRSTPGLLACDQGSLVNAVIQSSQLGLEIGGPLQQCYLVPYGKTAQLVLGYRGLMILARRSGEVLSIDVDVVYAKDGWTYNKTDKGSVFTHNPCEDEDAGELVRAYAVARMRGLDQPIVCVMPKRDIEKIRKRSPMGNTGAWVSDTAEMWKKSCIRRLCKILPASPELAKAVTFDERADIGLPQFDDVMDAEFTETVPDDIKNGKPTLADVVASEGGAA